VAKATQKTTKEGQPKTLEELRDICDKEYGQGSLIMGCDATVDVDIFPSGIATLDRELGCGGIPQGRILEVYGIESCGKTTLCHHLIAACQQFYFPKKDRHGVAAFIDAEHAIDPIWAQACGVNWDDLLFSQPNSGDEALQLAERIAKSKLVDLIVIDSVAALTPKSELDGEIGDNQIGAQARLMSQAMRKLESACAKSSCTIVFINQVREKIGVMFGNPETTPGGRALKFYASVRMEISKGTKLKEGETVIGFNPKLKIVKTKVGQPYREVTFNIHSGHPVSGIDLIASLVDVGIDAKILTKKGNHVSYGDKVLGNGMGNTYDTLRNDSELTLRLRNQIYDGLFAEVEERKAKARATGKSSVSTDDIENAVAEVMDDDD